MIISTTDIQLFQILKQKLGEKEAETLVTFILSKLKFNNESNFKSLATKYFPDGNKPFRETEIK